MRGFQFILKPWFLKLCLLFFLVFFIGLPQSCWQLHKESTAKVPKISKEEFFERQIVLDKYMEEKVINAKKNNSHGKVYTATDYFNDLKDFSRKVKELGLDGLGAIPSVSELQQISRESLKTTADFAALEVAKKDYQEFIDPGGKSSKKAQAEFNSLINSLGWKNVLTWLVLMYFKIMFFAFCYFSILIFENNKEKRQRLFPNPIRFLLLLMIYPAVIGYLIYKWLQKKERHYLAEAEYRRTKQNLFTYLSPEEIQKIKKFRESTLSLRSWREQLAASGLKPQHSLALALVVTLLVSFIPSLTQAETKKEGSCQHKVCLQQVVDQYAARISIEDDQPAHGFNHDWQDRMPATFEENDFNPIVTIWYLKILEKVFQLENVCRQIDHIPLYGYSANSLLNINLTE